MIADLDKTIRQLLIDELPIENDEIDIAFDQPKREWSARVSKPTINFFLYDVRENHHLRTHQWEVPANGQNSPLREGNRIARKRTPMRVDCLYMFTVWANDPADEHRILANTMTLLFRYPILPEERLEQRLRNPSYDIRTRVAAHDILTNPAEMWSALDNEIRPTISYMVTLTLDPWHEVIGPAVHTLDVTTGREERPHELETRRLEPENASARLLYIGGIVRDSKNDGMVVPGAEVVIEETDQRVRTDSRGIFKINGLPSGRYTLVARTEDGRQSRRSVVVPAAKDEDYNLEL